MVCLRHHVKVGTPVLHVTYSKSLTSKPQSPHLLHVEARLDSLSLCSSWCQDPESQIPRGLLDTSEYVLQNRLSVGGESADFQGVNNPTMAKFKLCV